MFRLAGSVYAEIDNVGIAAGFPRAIADDWPGLPSDIDAALSWPVKYKYQYSQNGNWVRKTNPARVYFFKVSHLNNNIITVMVNEIMDG